MENYVKVMREVVLTRGCNCSRVSMSWGKVQTGLHPSGVDGEVFQCLKYWE